MNISNWRIGFRLGGGFSLLILLLILVGSIAIVNLGRFHERVDTIVTKDYPLTVKGNNLINGLNDALLEIQLLLVLTEPEQINRKVEDVKAISQKLTALLDDLQNTANDEKSQVILRDIMRSREAFLATYSKVVQFSLSGERERGQAEFMDVMRPVQHTYKEQVTKLINSQDERMSASEREVLESYHFSRSLLVSMIVFGLLAGAMIAWLITRSVVRPIKDALQVAEKVANGDLTSSINVTRRDETGQLLLALDNMNGSLRAIVSQVRDGAETISTAASQIAAGNQDLSARTEEQASSLEETASSLEQLTSTIKNTAENTHQATSIAAEASQTAQHSSEVMGSVTERMRGIRDSSQRMADIIGVIDGIAFQTNILALNAAVEAARAGEQGRGFAVVASEVRSLAQRSATAAKEIKDLIDDSVDKVRDGMSLVENAGEIIEQLGKGAQNVSGIIVEIAQASREQSDGINQINLAVGQIDTTTQQNAALVEEAASAALSLQSQATSLTQMVSTFKLNASDRLIQPDEYKAPRQSTALPAAKLMDKSNAKQQEEANWSSF
ncbi:HAMP domain-containing protein [Affinibrenneria salicis]|uniref:HAMP domain-containing protein n=1 Tax=Affinibrenneria salicis TaxID=2590031 RepID=A0A5J5G341_9GAMM|nr:methyl-accepting chemotaxis protein [Affinibrenneria salicis]KAA9001182.1 HAMP domain-containing protein [Affinibrenneria salicis]